MHVWEGSGARTDLSPARPPGHSHPPPPPPRHSPADTSTMRTQYLVVVRTKPWEVSSGGGGASLSPRRSEYTLDSTMSRSE